MVYLGFYFNFTVNTLMIGKPEKGQMVENMLLRMAQSGQIVNKLGEDELIGLLEQVNNQMQGQERKTTVKVNELDILTLISFNWTFFILCSLKF